VDEFALIDRYFVRPSALPELVTGIGDDGAVIRPRAGKELVAVIDTMVAGTHFPVDMDAADIGYRIVAVNLSDIAAMAAEPRWMTLALTLVEAEPDWLEAFAAGLFEAADEFGVHLIGGDTTRGEQLVVSVQMAGDVDPGKALLRSGARIGDTIFVTGRLGDAAAGLRLLQAGTRDGYLVRRFTRPSARVGIGRALGGVANAAIDLSDGLVADVGKILQASGVGGELDVERLPLSQALVEQAGRDRAQADAMAGGDDYELCFTLPEDRLPRGLAADVTAIGHVTAGDRLVCRRDGVVVPFDDSGYRHFR